MKYTNTGSASPVSHVFFTFQVQRGLQATSEFQKPSLSKWDQVHNLYCENEFYLHENEKTFPYQRLSACFDTEARGNSAMVC